MTRLLLAAVVALAAVATADSLGPKDAGKAPARTASTVVAPVLHRSSGGYLAVGDLMRKEVLHDGRLYLSAASVDAAFPGREAGDPFDIAHVAAAPDGTVALAVSRFPAREPAEAAVELWRDGRLVGAFPVPAGAFGGGLGWADHGRLVATVLTDGFSVALFDRSGERVGSVSATSW